MGVAVVVFVFAAAGCGSGGRHSTTGSGDAQPTYTLRQVKAAFAAQGFRLQKSLGSPRNRLVVLFDPQRTGPFGYQRIGRKQPSVTQFLVFLSSGPHFTRRGNLTVYFAEGQGPIARAALRHLGR